MTIITDEIRSNAASIVALANQLDALPQPECPPQQCAPQSWPATLDCLGGTPATAITIVVGDGVPTGHQGEPAYSRRLANMPDGSIGIFGDSIVQGTHENQIHPAAVNYALGGQSLRRMINGLHGFAFMRSAGGGVIACGVNDLSNTTYYGPRDNQQAALTVLGMFQNKLAPWLTGKWVISHLLPCNEGFTGAYGYNAQCTQVNNGLAAALATTQAEIAFAQVNSELVDSSGNLKMAYSQDGQHLNKSGTVLFAASISAALASLGL